MENTCQISLNAYNHQCFISQNHTHYLLYYKKLNYIFNTPRLMAPEKLWAKNCALCAMCKHWKFGYFCKKIWVVMPHTQTHFRKFLIYPGENKYKNIYLYFARHVYHLTKCSMIDWDKKGMPELELFNVNLFLPAALLFLNISVW